MVDESIVEIRVAGKIDQLRRAAQAFGHRLRLPGDEQRGGAGRCGIAGQLDTVGGQRRQEADGLCVGDVQVAPEQAGNDDPAQRAQGHAGRRTERGDTCADGGLGALQGIDIAQGEG